MIRSCWVQGFWFAAACVTTMMLGMPLAWADDVKKTETVSLTIDFGGGDKRTFAELPLEKDSSVLKLLLAASRAAETGKEPLPVKFRGSGATAMVTEIGGKKNEGGSGRNWLYKLNDGWGETSADLARPKPGDAILWKFTKEQ